MNGLTNLDLVDAPDCRDPGSSSPILSTVALIDSQTLSRDCLAALLLVPKNECFSLRLFSTVAEMQQAPNFGVRLMILCTHQRTEELTHELLAAFPHLPAPTIIISDQPAAELIPLFRDSLKFGISGLVSTVDTHLETFRAAISFVMMGGTLLPRDLLLEDEALKSGAEKKPGCLTPRQRDVFTLMQTGKPNKIIAYQLGISESTIKVHVRSILRTLGASNRTEAVVKGGGCGMLI